ncbi:DUF4333 domain-containing protein [Pseudonocardia humida]|uniref:DUF4333 domain-containing protein n=1 Tax=Pseudonocardia humida TaxID=2800819 RepID=A0ABT0ZW05_9PSEU|nr:DUF4333 domain-containing protein [Pseudonocardia humida]MCO1654923.1 DUF4333 domain-containing protein [Pseudonocardia humida]
MSSISRGLATAGLVVVLGAGLAGCSGSVPKDDVASAIGGKLTEQGITADGVTCPEDLDAEVGKTVRCEFTVDGQPVDAVATVTSLQGDQANFDITTEARPVAKALLDRKVAEQVAQELQTEVDGADCAGDLAPEVGKSVTCAVTGGGESIDLNVSVTSVDGGLINYTLELA